MFRYFSLARTSQRPLGAVPDVGKGGTRRIPGSICCAGLGRSSRSVAPSCLIHWFFSFFSGGRGASKALGRVLLEQKVERQTCQRAALRELFEVENPYREFLRKKKQTSLHASTGFYSSEAVVVSCNEECQALESCVCSLCKCCLNCGNKCKCDFANTGADDSLARILLPEISDDYL